MMTAEGPKPTETRNVQSSDRTGSDVDARLFYERLAQSGQLVDVAENADLSALPPHVTHVRRPDGTIERIGFALPKFPETQSG